MAVRSRLSETDSGAPLFSAYSNSQNGMSYARHLYTTSPAMYPNVSENATFWTFVQTEGFPLLEEGAREYKSGIQTADPSKTRSGSLKQSAAAKLLGAVVILLLEGQTSFDLKKTWINAQVSAVMEPRTASDSRKRDRTSHVAAEVGARMASATAKKGTQPRDDAAVRSVGQWVNTRLMISNKYWNKLAQRVRETDAADVAEWMSLIRTIIRPMNPKDAGAALAGEVFLDVSFDPTYKVVSDADPVADKKRQNASANIAGYKTSLHEVLSYAAPPHRTSAFFEAGSG